MRDGGPGGWRQAWSASKTSDCATGSGPEVLRDLTFRIEPHSFQFLTGPSGAGKSSLLRLLFLSLKPTRGLITLFGHDIATLSKDSLATLRRRIGIVFQDFRLLDHMSTYENVALPLRILGRDGGELPARGRASCSTGSGWASGCGRCRRCSRAARSSAPRSRAPSSRARSSCSPTSRPATSIRRSRSGCCGCSSSSTSPGTSVVIATHDIALMDQYDARRLVLHEGRVHVYD